jgi:hypothetical protein
MRFLSILLLILALAAAQGYAAEPTEPAEGEEGPAVDGENAGDEAEGEAEPVVEEEPMTQGELAVAIVRMLGLESEIDANMGAKSMFALRPELNVRVYTNFLASRGVHPLPAWDPDAPVTIDVLAVVVVQVLGLIREVDNLEDPVAYRRVLEAHDLIVASIRDVLSEVEVINTVQIIRGSSLGGLYHRNLTPVAGQ